MISEDEEERIVKCISLYIISIEREEREREENVSEFRRIQNILTQRSKKESGYHQKKM